MAILGATFVAIALVVDSGWALALVRRAGSSPGSAARATA